MWWRLAQQSGAAKGGWAEGIKASAASAGTSGGAGGAALLGGALNPADRHGSVQVTAISFFFAFFFKSKTIAFDCVSTFFNQALVGSDLVCYWFFLPSSTFMAGLFSFRSA